MAEVTDRAKLETSIRGTVEWNFGTVCDEIVALVAAGALSAEQGEGLVKLVRRKGNDIIRVSINHLACYNVVRNHAVDQVNPRRVAHLAQGERHGSS
jgi:hypothetical protein